MLRCCYYNSLLSVGVKSRHTEHWNGDILWFECMEAKIAESKCVALFPTCESKDVPSTKLPSQVAISSTPSDQGVPSTSHDSG